MPQYFTQDISRQKMFEQFFCDAKVALSKPDNTTTCSKFITTCGDTLDMHANAQDMVTQEEDSTLDLGKRYQG